MLYKEITKEEIPSQILKNFVCGTLHLPVEIQQ